MTATGQKAHSLAEADRRHFDSIADQHCRKDQHPASRVARIERLRQSLRLVPEENVGDLLEIGCGAGFAARYLEGRYASYVGIDHSDRLIELAQSFNAGPNRKFQVADASTWKTTDRFHTILMIGVLHHVADPNGLVRNLAALLAPGGWLVANEPQPANPLIRLARSLRMRADRSYSPQQTQLSARQLTGFFTSAGLTDVTIRPQGLLSTPFAETTICPAVPGRALATCACAADRLVEACASRPLRYLSWNLVAAGRAG